MLSIRKIRTASGSTAIQVVIYQAHRAIVIKHIGSAKNKEELHVLLLNARKYIDENTGQISLFNKKNPQVLIVDRAQYLGVTHHFAYQFFLACATQCGLSKLPPLLIDLALMRLIEPASKRRTLYLLGKYFNISYSQRIYQKIPKLLR